MTAVNNQFAGAMPLDERLRAQLQLRQPRAVKVVETHISWVFLTDKWALKLKKPVKFDFLDFSTLELRRGACEEEVRLNRRLAGDVYVGVRALELDEEGKLYLTETPDIEVVDWVVKMHRLPAERSLDRLIEADVVTDEQIAQIANHLTEFYRQLAPVAISADAYCNRMALLIVDNREALLNSTTEVARTRIKRIHASQLTFMRLSTRLFESRAQSHIVDGHGDLRPEHIYVTADPVVIDCIEFNSEIRQLDVADELAFLEMECEFLGAPAVGRQIAESVLGAIDANPPEQLLSFYKSFRACVRAKVSVLRAKQAGSEQASHALDEAQRYLALAEQYAACIGSPLLLIVRGLMGTGKSTIAKKLAVALGADLLQTDWIRRQLFNSPGTNAEYGEGIYAEDGRRKVYDEMFSRTESALCDGGSVILDGTFLTAELRQRAASIAANHQAGFLIVNCHCPDDVVRQRIADRQAAGESASEARPELLELQRADEQQVSSELPQCDIDTSRDQEQLQAVVLQRLRALDGLRLT